MKRYRFVMWTAALILLLWAESLRVDAAGHQTIYNSPYVTFSPDGKAWTTNAGDTNCVWYNQGTTVTTGITSSIQKLETGQHYYDYYRQGEVPVGKWEVVFRTASCIHHIYPGNYHGIIFNTKDCARPYYSGWAAYCADCGGVLTNMYIYMSTRAAESIDYLEIRADMDYYYLCPYCRNLEQGVPMGQHLCRGVSWNRYKVVYDPNASDFSGELMESSVHMYNNVTEYEGNALTAARHLSRNTYTRKDYEFVEWNTKPDGTGLSYADEAEVKNLTAVDGGVVTLYAQWRPARKPLRTRQLNLESGENVYRAQDKIWYVRSDGKTPFALKYQAYVDGPAFLDYQPNYAILQFILGEAESKDILYTPSHQISSGEIRTEAEDLTYSRQGSSPIRRYPYTVTVRSNRNRELSAVQKYVLDSGLSGMQFEIMPIAGADSQGSIVYSDPDMDRGNSILVVADGEAPVINGMEVLEHRELIDRGDGVVMLTVYAVDSLSGLRELYVNVVNTDNSLKQVYYPDDDGCIRIEITKDELIFGGDLVISAHAVDNVGNMAEVTYEFTEFALKARVERILEPHDPIFKRGESGYLLISVWGYAERVEVEFPQEMTAWNPELNTTFVYTEHPDYLQKEKIQFMIPLNTPANQHYTIIVRAYKGDKKLEEYPSVSTVQVEGTVLNEFRTRLR